MEQITIQTPLDDYELIDFGRGRKLERFGTLVLDRPEALAKGELVHSPWVADWRYQTTAYGEWQPQHPDLPKSWSVRIDACEYHLSLQTDGSVGCAPEQIACGRWVKDCVSGVYDLSELNVLNLFGGDRGATFSAYQAGCSSVLHADADLDHLRVAKEGLGRADIEWVCENANALVDDCLRRKQQFELIVLRPPLRVYGPHHKSWDIKADMARLLEKLPRLCSAQCRGLWFAPLMHEWRADSLHQLLKETFPGQPISLCEMAIATRAGRRLPTGTAAYWRVLPTLTEESSHNLPLSALAIEELLDVYLGAVLSSRRTAATQAQNLAPLNREQQEFVLHWAQIMSASNAEMAYQFVACAPQALRVLAFEQVREWILRVMDIYDTSGLYGAVAQLNALDLFAAEVGSRKTAVEFDSLAVGLRYFIQGLQGRSLKLEVGDCVYTDSETLFLPAREARLATTELNLALFRATAVFLWAQNGFGTWRREVLDALLNHADDTRLLQRFAYFENIRLEACIARYLPGFYRQIEVLHALDTTAAPALSSGVVEQLRAVDATALTAFELAVQKNDDTPRLTRLYHCSVFPDRVFPIFVLRAERERDAVQNWVLKLKSPPTEPVAAPDVAPVSERLLIRAVEDKASTPLGDVEVMLDGLSVAPPADIRLSLKSIIQDFGAIPPEYLQAAGSGGYALAREPTEEKTHSVWDGTYHEEGVIYYPEWDCKRAQYRKNWCVLRELVGVSADLAFFNQTLTKYRPLLGQLRRIFEALRGEEKTLKRQPHGDDVDVDALVEALADHRSGLEMTECLFVKKRKLERSIAVVLMVDMSGSTKGWINDAERESLILRCEALETLGDRYAIYGFSGLTRKRCELFRIKRFDEEYDDLIKGRICGIQPRDYTRMGVTIRHLTEVLIAVEARTKLLITLSDGKPDDSDGYRGEYGIEDTRQALLEAKLQGIHPFCITIDREAEDYLPHMYGAVNYSVVEQVSQLPLKVSDIYRRLTR